MRPRLQWAGGRGEGRDLSLGHGEALGGHGEGVWVGVGVGVSVRVGVGVGVGVRVGHVRGAGLQRVRHGRQGPVVRAGQGLGEQRGAGGRSLSQR